MKISVAHLLFVNTFSNILGILPLGFVILL